VTDDSKFVESERPNGVVDASRGSDHVQPGSWDRRVADSRKIRRDRRKARLKRRRQRLPHARIFGVTMKQQNRRPAAADRQTDRRIAGADPFRLEARTKLDREGFRHNHLLFALYSHYA